jgi:trehalose 6-phosphate synthase
VELGAPSRTHIQKYHDFVAEVEKTAEAVNWRFQSKTWKPILLLKAHHSHETIIPFYQAADLCMVTSLHDGMNLVAKEFVSARSDEDGVLILSQFTGASRELRDAVIVNPYDIEAMAEAIYISLEMPAEERARRMKQMRTVDQDRNVYRWAANIITAMSKLPSSDRKIENESLA